jgi:hypothetical protein
MRCGAIRRNSVSLGAYTELAGNNLGEGRTVEFQFGTNAPSQVPIMSR